MSTTFINRGHFYAPHVMPVLLDCNFLVDPTNINGLGISDLKGQGIANVFMNTSATPAAGPNGKLNPNPAAGYIMVQLADNYSRLFSANSIVRRPLSGSNLAVNGSALTAGRIYVISVLGTSVAADWIALGVPPGVTPAVGVAFVALVAGSGSGSGQVQLSIASGNDQIELVGASQLSLSAVPVGGSPNIGGFLYFVCSLNNAIAAPVALSRIHLEMYLSQSSVTVAGE